MWFIFPLLLLFSLSSEPSVPEETEEESEEQRKRKIRVKNITSEIVKADTEVMPKSVADEIEAYINSDTFSAIKNNIDLARKTYHDYEKYIMSLSVVLGVPAKYLFRFTAIVDLLDVVFEESPESILEFALSLVVSEVKK